MYVVLSRSGRDVRAQSVDDGGRVIGEPQVIPATRLPEWVDAQEAQRSSTLRWTWSDTRDWYPSLLGAGLRVRRAHDLRLSHRILVGAQSRPSRGASAAPAQEGPPLRSDASWTAPEPVGGPPPPADAATLFDDAALLAVTTEPDVGVPWPATADGSVPFDPVEALQAQLRVIDALPGAAGLRLLVAAESAGALAAAEMRAAGLPWRADIHAALLEAVLGPRPSMGARPVELERLAGVLRHHLDDRALNPDSPTEVLRALRRAGLSVSSTSKWELQRVEHPVIEPLLEYKRRARLYAANGWVWLDTWVRDGRFRPEYVVGGVVSGRWAGSGGGALQLPKQIRSAVVADPGWRLVVADAAQLEPRVLAALSRDHRMADAGRGRDLYDGIVATGAVEDRSQAKSAMLGAMYGATQGRGGQLVPRLARAFPLAIAYVERAARAGERGESVTSLLGRASPQPSAAEIEAERAAFAADAVPGAERAARARARSRGRFTRNFVVQATAAEWALAWMAGVRTRLRERFPGPLEHSPHLAYFLHDELVVHAPAASADAVADIVRESAAEAGRILFGTFPITFPLSVAVVDDYSAAKDAPPSAGRGITDTTAASGPSTSIARR
ncbi:bifunctional 3'-5' exonuclease/DNA polymerase [Curtobacterium ammoniigenes]|uniref:bifunctional 3'-5' exonuclease/DNA polymerase n=1 Tax=Curtobacterium ammoniigenes TaxID=395387 RepID=UPI0009FAEF4B|nr:bifunctional 3'-5' exonuclease/DNA polymerase [Curtobacterium ammoniigenes]